MDVFLTVLFIGLAVGIYLLTTKKKGSPTVNDVGETPDTDLPKPNKDKR